MLDLCCVFCGGIIAKPSTATFILCSVAVSLVRRKRARLCHATYGQQCIAATHNQKIWTLGNVICIGARMKISESERNWQKCKSVVNVKTGSCHGVELEQAPSNITSIRSYMNRGFDTLIFHMFCSIEKCQMHLIGRNSFELRTTFQNHQNRN